MKVLKGWMGVWGKEGKIFQNFSFLPPIFLLLLLFFIYFYYYNLEKPPLFDGVPFSTRVVDRHGGLLRLGLTADQKYRVFTPLEDTAPELVEATLLYEDRFFYWHPGVNPVALLRAAWGTFVTGGRRFGASTITMQVARLRFGLNTSTIGGKLRQMKLALALERHYGKREILEAYFNLAPYGGNVEGVGAAALVYFHSEARKLTLSESLALVGVPQNPTRRNPQKESERGASELAAARARISAIWLTEHPEDAGNAFFHHLPLTVHGPADLPFLAPHVSMEGLAAGTEHQYILTTIDRRAQELLEGRIRGFVTRGARRGIKNACAVLVHWPGMEIRALAGSADFGNTAIQGQVDGTRARRSPGSTLKPFIYALALEQGLIHPRTLLYDAPRSFKGYEPENSDGRFRGPLTARDALVESRNIPAINLANQLRSPDLYEFLREARVELTRTRNEYGLALVLGGAEVTPRELAALYGVLANRGVWNAPILFRNIEKKLPSVHLLSPEAAALALDMLRDNGTARRVSYIGLNTPKLPVYFKTGTSNGYRDAWSAGIFGPYVLVTWVGNFDGKPNMAFVGATSAAELFLDVAEAFGTAERLEDTVLNHMGELNLAKIPVCADTGDIDVSLCPEKVASWFIPGVSPIASSGIYREIMIDETTGLRACPGREGKREAWAFWPSDLRNMFREAGTSKKRPPPFGADCADERGGETLGHAPVILSPKDRLVYQRGAGDSVRVVLLARAEADVRELYWFYGKTFIGRAAPEEPVYWTPPGGRGIIRVSDDFGRMDSREISVELIP